jgi:hypothetical protein
MGGPTIAETGKTTGQNGGAGAGKTVRAKFRNEKGECSIICSNSQFFSWLEHFV